jgi:hypothetical protein
MSYSENREFGSWPRVAIVGLMAILACIALVGEVSGRRVANERAAQAHRNAAAERQAECGYGKTSAGAAGSQDSEQHQRRAMIGNDFPEIEVYGHVYAIA